MKLDDKRYEKPKTIAYPRNPTSYVPKKKTAEDWEKVKEKAQFQIIEEVTP